MSVQETPLTASGENMKPWAIASATLGLLALALGPFQDGAVAQQTVLRVSGTGANPPFHFLDPATGEQRGVALDLFSAIVTDLGMTLEVHPVIPLGEMIAAIRSGAIDTYGGNISITPERAAALAFSDPWYVNVGEGVWVLATDTTDYRSVYDFAGQLVGAQRDSATYNGLAALGIFSGVRQYETEDQLAQAVVGGEIRAGFLPYDTSAYVLFQGTYPLLKIPDHYLGSVNYGLLIAMPFMKGNEALVERVNGALDRLIAHGTMENIFANYGLDWARSNATR